MTTIGLATDRAAVGIAKVYVDTWRSAYAGLLPNRVLIGMSYERQAREWSWVIRNRADAQPAIVAAEPNRAVVGFVSFGLRSIADPPASGPHPGAGGSNLGDPLTPDAPPGLPELAPG